MIDKFLKGIVITMVVLITGVIGIFVYKIRSTSNQPTVNTTLASTNSDSQNQDVSCGSDNAKDLVNQSINNILKANGYSSANASVSFVNTFTDKTTGSCTATISIEDNNLPDTQPNNYTVDDFTYKIQLSDDKSSVMLSADNVSQDVLDQLVNGYKNVEQYLQGFNNSIITTPTEVTISGYVDTGGRQGDFHYFMPNDSGAFSKGLDIFGVVDSNHPDAKMWWEALPKNCYKSSNSLRPCIVKVLVSPESGFTGQITKLISIVNTQNSNASSPDQNNNSSSPTSN